jgi:hypothetical protein
MTETRYMGIDPGKSGGWAVLNQDGTVWGIGKNADLDTMFAALQLQRLTIMMEKVGASPQMGTVSAFSFGESYGFLNGFVTAVWGTPLLVTPKKWQSEFGLILSGRKLGRGATDKKNANKAMAERLFPGQKITHAWADALLIAEYCRRVYS